MMQRDNVAEPVGACEHYPGIYMVMGDTAEVVAKRYGISREAQDEYALVSQQRTARAQQDGLLRERDRADAGRARRARQEDRREDRRGGAALDRDECNRPDTTLEGLAKLPPVFDRRAAQGSVTAGNSSQLSDGASATLVMSADRAKALGIDAARSCSAATPSPGCEPDEMGIGPVFAVPKLLKRSRPARRRHRRVGAERGVRLAGRLLPRHARHPDGSAEPERRLDLDRPPLRHDRLAPGRHDRATRCSAGRRRYGVVTMCVGGGKGAAALFERAVRSD